MIIRKLDSTDVGFAAQLRQVFTFEASEDEAIDRAAARILTDVKACGDAVVLEATCRFDRIEAESVAALELSPAALQTALDGLESKRRAAPEAAAVRVRTYREKQKIKCGTYSWEYAEADGTVLGQKVTPLGRVGTCVPGGKAVYPPSVLMNAIPARVARVKEIIMVVSTPDGVRSEPVLAAACIVGVDRMFTIGGAQAVGALAYGTDTVPAVDRIAGPGNAYVVAVKRRVFGTVGIDMIAGLSEIFAICDGTTDPDWVVMDLFSQAEHDELAQSTLLCPNAEFVAQVETSINYQPESISHWSVITESLSGWGALVKVRDMEEAYDIANDIASEHLEVSAENPRQWTEHTRYAGAIFLSKYTSESLGNYCVGLNHVPPTSRTARFSSPLGVYDFIKRSSLTGVSEVGVQALDEIAAELACGEGLQAHIRSAEYRLQRPMSEWHPPYDDDRHRSGPSLPG